MQRRHCGKIITEEYKKIESTPLLANASHINKVDKQVSIHGKLNDILQNDNKIELNSDLKDKIQQMQLAECDMTKNSPKDNAKSNLDLWPTALVKGLKCNSNIDPASEELGNIRGVHPKTCYEINKTVNIEKVSEENLNTSKRTILAFPMGVTPKKKRKRKNKKKILNC